MKIFTEEDLNKLQSMHSAYRTVAEELERVTNNIEFADGLLQVLAYYVRDARDKHDAMLRSAYKHWMEQQEESDVCSGS